MAENVRLHVGWFEDSLPGEAVALGARLADILGDMMNVRFTPDGIVHEGDECHNPFYDLRLSFRMIEFPFEAKLAGNEIYKRNRLFDLCAQAFETGPFQV